MRPRQRSVCRTPSTRPSRRSSPSSDAKRTSTWSRLTPSSTRSSPWVSLSLCYRFLSPTCYFPLYLFLEFLFICVLLMFESIRKIYRQWNSVLISLFYYICIKTCVIKICYENWGLTAHNIQFVFLISVSLFYLALQIRREFLYKSFAWHSQISASRVW